MRTTEKLTKEEFALGLKKFIGTEQYWDHKLLGAFTLRLTDGCNYVRVEAEARWLFDTIASLQFDHRIQLHPFQRWQLKKLEDSWSLECIQDDGGQMLIKTIEYSDFPIDQIRVSYVH